MDFLKRKPKDLDGAEADGRDAVDETGSIIDNDKAQKRQRMLFFGLGGVAVVASTMYVLRTETVVEEATKPGHETEVSTDALMNRQRVDQEWMAIYEGQVNSQDQRLKGVEAQAGQVAQLQSEIQALRGENAAMARDGQQENLRQHALDLWARLSQQQPAEALPLLPALISAADRFDTLGVPVQHRLRRLIVRHRALSE